MACGRTWPLVSSERHSETQSLILRAIDAFYAKLPEALDKIPKSGVVVVLIMGDLNSKVGQ